MSESEANMDLFKDVRYYAVGALDPKIKEKLSKAKTETYLTSLVTHAIVSDPTCYEAEKAQELWQIPTVTPLWVEMSIKCNQLLPTNGFLSSTNQPFSACVVCFSGMNKTDKEALWGLVTFHGGKCKAKLNKDVTHLVVPTTSGAKYDEAVKHDIQCVAPDWVTDCVKQKQRLDASKYHPNLNVIPKPVVKKELPADVPLAVKSMTVSEVVPKPPPVPAADKMPVKALKQEPEVSVTEAGKPLPVVPSVAKSPGSSAPIRPGQSTTPSRQTAEPQFSPNNPSMMQQMRYGIPTQMYRQGTPTTNPRFFAGSHPMRSPLNPNPSMMMPSTMTSQSFQTSPAQQGFQMMSPNQMMMSGSGQPPQMMMQQQSMSPNQPFMSPQPRSTSGSPRRNSGNQTPGSKKKKMGNQSNRVSPHSTIRQVHPMGQNFQPKPGQTQFNPQQMILKGKVPGAMDQSGGMVSPQMMQKMGEKPRMGLRPPGMMQPGRFPTSGDFSSLQHQQMMHMQMQQQQIRMNMLQTSPGSQAAPHGGMGDPMGQKWPRTSGDPNFPGDQHQSMFPGQQQQTPPNFSQGQMMQPQGHQFMMSRMPGQMQASPQQQFMFRERSPGAMNANQFPKTSSLEAAGIAGISPLALQQGLMNLQHQGDQPALIHPSLQGAPKVPSTQQSGGSVPKKRTKSRKKTETGDEETKPKPRARTTKAKKPQVPTTPTNPMNQPQMGEHPPGMPQQPHFHPQGVMTSQLMMPSPRGQYMGQGQHQFPPGHPQAAMAQHAHPMHAMGHPRPAAVPANQHLPNQQLQPQTHSIPAVAPERGKQEALVSETRGKFVDPLLCDVKEIDGQFAVREATEKVPPDLFLLGCIFYICEYEEVLSDVSVIELWKKMIQKFGGVVEDSYLPICTHVICATATTPIFRQAIADRKRCVTVYWLNDVMQLRILKVPWLAIHLPTVFPLNDKPAVKHTISYSGFHAKERERLKMMAFVCGAKFTGYFSRSNTALVCKRTKSAKMDKAKEWRIPCVTLRWMRDSLHSCESVDMLQTKYQKFDDDAETAFGLILDFSKSQQFLEAWKMKIHVSPESLSKSQVKRKLESMPPSPSPAKCPRPSETFHALPRVCFTGFAPITVQELGAKITNLGGRVESTLTLCTHLVANHVSRTVKFLSCISSCAHVVTPGWIEESFKAKELLDEQNFHLVDKAAETKFNFSLQETIRRARKSPLFKDCLFAITHKVVPERQTLRQIIECGGGKVLSKMPSCAVIKHVHSRASPQSRIFVISCPDDDSVYLSLKKEGIPVHNAEIVLSGVLRQEINTELYRL